MVIPIFIFAYLAVMQLLWVILAQMGIMNALYDTGTGLVAMTPALEDRQYVSATQATVSFHGKLNKDYVENAGIVGGTAGITLLESRIKPDLSEIFLRADYIFSNKFNFVGTFLHNYTQTLYFRGWVGCNELSRDKITHNPEIVYITDYGQVYHTYRGCPYLNPSVRQTVRNNLVNIRNESGGRYYPCKKCYNDTYVIYITDYGDSYHSDKNCSGLKRGIMAVSIEKVSSMELCSKCSKNNKQE
ncbi:MAG: hypothetical protein ACI4EV_04085 [Lachnospiraceae bacterium]